MPIDPASPFVLLDDASFGPSTGAAAARLYTHPRQVVAAHTIAEVRPALEALRTARAEGLHAAGYLAYEAGAAFEPVLGAPVIGAGPLLWFGLFDGWRDVAPDDVAALLPDPAGAWIGTPRPDVDFPAYDARFAQVAELIAAGDIYQANLSYRATVPFVGSPLALYAQLRARAQAGYGAVVHTGTEWLVSLSPELFFSLDADRLVCAPMKGTVRRGATPAEDAALAAALRDDPKQRAENLMIVDLLRNDLSRVATAGSVQVPALFTVQTYPTLHTMISTITADLAPAHDAIDVVVALFPCGSVTGAPKIRAMQALAEIEQESAPRGAYTGSIGRLDANGDAAFNVAIRTLTIRNGTAQFGVGGGIVADSRSGEEWDEAHAKSDFLGDGRPRFDLIETMAFDPMEGILLLERHLARMKESADLFGFAFDRHAARNELQAATFRLRARRRLRLVLSPSGAVAIESAPPPATTPGPVTVAIVPLPVDPADFRLRHKTSDRGFYDRARHDTGMFEVLFIDRDGYLTEGSFTSLFVERDGVLVTPPLTRGLLPGILRAELIESGRAIEGNLTVADLAHGFFIGNALRGLIPAVVAVADRNTAGL